MGATATALLLLLLLLQRSWHLDTRLLDPCWSFDPSTVAPLKLLKFDTPETGSKPVWHLTSVVKRPGNQVPLADWIPRQGSDPHNALLKLTDEINSGLGRHFVPLIAFRGSVAEPYD